MYVPVDSQLTMFLLLVFLSAVAGAALVLPLVLCVYRLPKFPRDRVDVFLEQARGGPIAHRGGIPENTLRAFSLSKTNGAIGVEVDLQFSKDGHPVLIHDDTVERTSNGRGRVEELTLEQLRELDFGVKFGSQFAGEQIPTLQEALDLCEELDLLLFIDLKGGSTPEVVQVIRQLFQERPHLSNRVCVASFWPWLLYKIRSMNSAILCGLTLRTTFFQYEINGKPRSQELWKHTLTGLLDTLVYWCICSWIWKLLGVSLLLPHKGDILKKRINLDQWYRRGIQLVTWTVNSNAEKHHFESVLQIPYMTDSVNKEVGEQNA